MTLVEINALSQAEFTQVLGPVFEHSPWIAADTWRKRPFATLDALHTALCATVASSGEVKQLALIRAHPDLVGRAARFGTLTRESSGEQASAGLNRLTAGEIAAFHQANAAYLNRFGFPFVICARLNKKEAILEGFRIRLDHTREEEIKSALEEIGKIAYLRLRDLIQS